VLKKIRGYCEEQVEKKTLGDLCEVFADGDWVESKDQSPEVFG